MSSDVRQAGTNDGYGRTGTVDVQAEYGEQQTVSVVAQISRKRSLG